MIDSVWRPFRSEWTDGDGIRWHRHRTGLDEKDAGRFALRRTGNVVIEIAGTHELKWLEPDERHTFWHELAAGHIESPRQRAQPNRDGLAYHVSTWRNESGERLTLFSESC